MHPKPLSLSLCQSNLHMRVARRAPPNRTVLRSPASDRRKENACFSAVPSEVGWGQQLHARAFLRSLRRPPCSGLGAGNQHAVLVMREGRVAQMFCNLAYRSQPVLQRAEISTSKFTASIAFLHPDVVAAALHVIAWAKAAVAVRGHFFVSNTLCEARSPNSDPVWTFRRRTSWLTSDMPKDAQMVLDSRSLSKPTFSPNTSSSRQCSLSLSLSLSLSDEPSHESRNGSTSNQNCARTTLPAAEEAQQQDAPQLWIPAPSSMRLLVQWVLHRPTACGLHCPFAAAVATKSRSNLVPSPPSLP